MHKVTWKERWSQVSLYWNTEWYKQLDILQGLFDILTCYSLIDSITFLNSHCHMTMMTKYVWHDYWVALLSFADVLVGSSVQLNGASSTSLINDFQHQSSAVCCPDTYLLTYLLTYILTYNKYVQRYMSPLFSRLQAIKATWIRAILGMPRTAYVTELDIWICSGTGS